VRNCAAGHRGKIVRACVHREAKPRAAQYIAPAAGLTRREPTRSVGASRVLVGLGTRRRKSIRVVEGVKGICAIDLELEALAELQIRDFDGDPSRGASSRRALPRFRYSPGEASSLRVSIVIAVMAGHPSCSLCLVPYSIPEIGPRQLESSRVDGRGCRASRAQSARGASSGRRWISRMGAPWLAEA